MADRIQGRAVRRAGELLKQFNNERARTDLNEGALTQKKAAAAAGMSDHQRVQAVRVANVPAEKFEAAIATRVTRQVTRASNPALARVNPRGQQPAQ